MTIKPYDWNWFPNRSEIDSTDSERRVLYVSHIHLCHLEDEPLWNDRSGNALTPDELFADSLQAVEVAKRLFDEMSNGHARLDIKSHLGIVEKSATWLGPGRERSTFAQWVNNNSNALKDNYQGYYNAGDPSNYPAVQPKGTAVSYGQYQDYAWDRLLPNRTLRESAAGPIAITGLGNAVNDALTRFGDDLGRREWLQHGRRDGGSLAILVTANYERIGAGVVRSFLTDVGADGNLVTQYCGVNAGIPSLWGSNNNKTVGLTVAHELFHLLTFDDVWRPEFPDLYNRENAAGYMGDTSLMGNSWTGAHVSGYWKARLGWVRSRTIKPGTDDTVTLRPVYDDNGEVVIFDPTPSGADIRSDDLFVMEYRTGAKGNSADQLEFDQQLGVAAGVSVTHINRSGAASVASPLIDVEGNKPTLPGLHVTGRFAAGGGLGLATYNHRHRVLSVLRFDPNGTDAPTQIGEKHTGFGCWTHVVPFNFVESGDPATARDDLFVLDAGSGEWQLLTFDDDDTLRTRSTGTLEETGYETAVAGRFGQGVNLVLYRPSTGADRTGLLDFYSLDETGIRRVINIDNAVNDISALVTGRFVEGDQSAPELDQLLSYQRDSGTFRLFRPDSNNTLIAVSEISVDPSDRYERLVPLRMPGRQTDGVLCFGGSQPAASHLLLSLAVSGLYWAETTTGSRLELNFPVGHGPLPINRCVDSNEGEFIDVVGASRLVKRGSLVSSAETGRVRWSVYPEHVGLQKGDALDEFDTLYHSGARSRLKLVVNEAAPNQAEVEVSWGTNEVTVELLTVRCILEDQRGILESRDDEFALLMSLSLPDGAGGFNTFGTVRCAINEIDTGESVTFGPGGPTTTTVTGDAPKIVLAPEKLTSYPSALSQTKLELWAINYKGGLRDLIDDEDFDDWEGGSPPSGTEFFRVSFNLADLLGATNGDVIDPTPGNSSPNERLVVHSIERDCEDNDCESTVHTMRFAADANPEFVYELVFKTSLCAAPELI